MDLCINYERICMVQTRIWTLSAQYWLSSDYGRKFRFCDFEILMKNNFFSKKFSGAYSCAHDVTTPEAACSKHLPVPLFVHAKKFQILLCTVFRNNGKSSHIDDQIFWRKTTSKILKIFEDVILVSFFWQLRTCMSTLQWVVTLGVLQNCYKSAICTYLTIWIWKILNILKNFFCT